MPRAIPIPAPILSGTAACTCGHNIRPGIELSFHATQVLMRTCRYCRTRWHLVVRPSREILPGAFATEITMTVIPRRKDVH